MTQKSDGTNTWTWSYDYENRQTGYDAPGTSDDATYVYDANSRRINKTVNSVVEKFFHDGSNIIVDYDSSNNVSATYVTPFLDQNLLVNRSSSDYYYMQDGLGSVRNLIDSSETIQNDYDYYAFGEDLNWSEAIDNRYTFTGREYDSESLNYYYRARYLNSLIGRFTQRDPINFMTPGRLNKYAYVLNNPANLIDPSGGCVGTVGFSIPEEMCCVDLNNFRITNKGWIMDNTPRGDLKGQCILQVSMQVRYIDSWICKPSCCEYRQFVRGKATSTKNGVEIVDQLELSDGVFLDPVKYNEDGWYNSDDKKWYKYGYRDNPNPTEMYNTQPTFETYAATDDPGLFWLEKTYPDGTQRGYPLSLQLEYMSYVWDKCNDWNATFPIKWSLTIKGATTPKAANYNDIDNSSKGF